MNFNRRSHREDVLFVIALVVPAIFAGARYFESDRQMTQIAQTRPQAALIASAHHQPASVIVAKTETPGL